MTRVQLILVDGLRPDALAACKNPYVAQLLENSLYTLTARTVMPSVTLPCHMSLFHSVDPMRHGITTNTFTPQVRPINGLCEQLKGTKQCGIFYNWEQLKDLAQPGSLTVSSFFSGTVFGYEQANQLVTEASIREMAAHQLDFTFTYLGWTDEAGHAEGWLSEEYMRSVDESFRCIERLIHTAPEDCVTIILADHGGHGRMHGTPMEEDMRIPIILHGPNLRGTIDREVSIMDVAPTITHLLGCENAPEWEGKSLL